MKVQDFLEKVILFPIHILSWVFLVVIGLGNIAIIVLVFLVAPLSILWLIKSLFPLESEEVVVKFYFTWFELIFYIPAVILAYILIVKWVYPISKLTFINFIDWPIKDAFKIK